MFNNKSVAVGAFTCDHLLNATNRQYGWEQYVLTMARDLTNFTTREFFNAARVGGAELQALFMQSVMYMDTVAPHDLHNWYPEFAVPHMLGSDPSQLSTLPSTYAPVMM